MILLVPKELNMSNNKLKCGAVKGDDPQSSHCSYNSMVQELTQLLKIPLVINSQNFIFSSDSWVRKEQLSIFFPTAEKFYYNTFYCLEDVYFLILTMKIPPNNCQQFLGYTSCSWFYYPFMLQ